MLEIVEFSGGTVENVDYNGSIVQCEPVACVISFSVKRGNTDLFKSVGKLVSQSVDMGRGTTLADNEVIGKRGLVFYLEELDSSCLLLVQDSDDRLSKSLQKLPNLSLLLFQWQLSLLVCL